jgi:hypothetical protein
MEILAKAGNGVEIQIGGIKILWCIFEQDTNNLIVKTNNHVIQGKIARLGQRVCWKNGS